MDCKVRRKAGKRTRLVLGQQMEAGIIDMSSETKSNTAGRVARSTLLPGDGKVWSDKMKVEYVRAMFGKRGDGYRITFVTPQEDDGIGAPKIEGNVLTIHQDDFTELAAYFEEEADERLAFFPGDL
jgi:hypothetical protein